MGAGAPGEARERRDRIGRQELCREVRRAHKIIALRWEEIIEALVERL